jgi:hypothetical protein
MRGKPFDCTSFSVTILYVQQLLLTIAVACSKLFIVTSINIEGVAAS